MKERERQTAGEGQREREREKPKQGEPDVRAVRAEPDVGLEPMNHEIMT